MQVELTSKQADVIVEALGLALQVLPPVERVAVAANEYAPIVQSIQQAARSLANQPEAVVAEPTSV